MNVQYLSAGLGERVNLKAVRDCYAKKGCACACVCVCFCQYVYGGARAACAYARTHIYIRQRYYSKSLFHCTAADAFNTHTHTRLLGNVCRSDLQIHLLPEWRAAFTCLCVFLGNGVNEGTTTKKKTHTCQTTKICSVRRETNANAIKRMLAGFFCCRCCLVPCILSSQNVTNK